MKKILLITLAVIVVVLGVFSIIVAMQPAEFKVTRSAAISAPAPAVFALVNDFHKWDWNPWAKVDPAIKITLDGPAAGKGAVYSWVGNSEVGEGKLTISESKPGELVRLDMEFFKPMAGTSISEFTFAPKGDQTQVTWTMSGQNNFIAKAMCMFINMDKMIGDQFDKGLADMKAIAEKPAPK